MAESILKLKVDSTEYDSKIKRAAQGLQAYAEGCRKVGGTLEVVEKDTLAYVKALGKMETTSKGTKSSLNEMTNAFTDLSMEYKKLTDQEKASPFGKALSASLDQLKGRIQQTKNDFNEITNQISGGGVAGKAGGLFGGGKLDGMLQVFGGNLMTKAAGWAASFAVDLGECVNQGIELAKQSEGVRLAFERLNRPGLLDNLNEATHGTVTNLELMKAAVKFDDFKLPVEELGTMLAFAQKKAKDTGQSIDYMVDSIVTGLGRKSLMILDNLGLSAAEIKEKMKETGDMTKAVGEIIREQMAKAGEYVETSADKAAQADKRLKDAMEELGRTFQPLTDAGNTMWSDLKVGALNLLNSAVRPLIDAFTELGRVRSQYASQGGDARVNRQLGVLSGIHTKQYQRNTYNAQLRNYDTKIGSYEQYLTDYKKWQSDKTAVGAYDRMQAFQKQTGLSMYSDVKEQLEVFKKMRAEYVMGAKSIIADNPAPSPASQTTTTNTKGGSKSSTPTIDDFNKILFKSMNANIKPDDIMGPSDAWTAYTGDIRTGLEGIDGELTNLTKFTKNFDPHLEFLKEAAKRTEQVAKANELAAQSASNLGSALASLDDPSAKAAGTVIQAIANIALSFSQAATQAASLGSYGWIAYMAAGTAALATTISTIHSLTGFSEGGEVKGNTYSSDQIPIMANAGEVVLTRAMAGNLASQLQGAGNGQIQATGILQGENILIALERTLKRKGYGELATWK